MNRRERRARLNDIHRISDELRRPVETPDLSAAILSRVHEERPFLSQRARWYVLAGRGVLGLSAGLVVLGVVLTHRFAGSAVEAVTGQGPVTAVVSTFEHGAGTTLLTLDGLAEFDGRFGPSDHSCRTRLSSDRAGLLDALSHGAADEWPTRESLQSRTLAVMNTQLVIPGGEVPNCWALGGSGGIQYCGPTMPPDVAARREGFRVSACNGRGPSSAPSIDSLMGGCRYKSVILPRSLLPYRAAAEWTAGDRAQSEIPSAWPGPAVWTTTSADHMMAVPAPGGPQRMITPIFLNSAIDAPFVPK